MSQDLDLVIVGSVGLDTIATPRERRERILGGSASYACAAASYFAQTGMVGVVGTDFPADYRALYESFGIDLSGLQTQEGETFFWSGEYEENMDNRTTLVTELNVFEHFSPDLPDTYHKAPYLFLGNIAPELQLHVLNQVDQPRFTLVDTMDLWINIAHDALVEVVKRVDMLTLNESEARLFTGKHNLMAAAETLLALGPRHVLIKKGEHGSMLFSQEGGIFILPAFPVAEVHDPTGAGDTFAGGLMGYLAHTGDTSELALRRAMVHGGVIASFGVEKFSLERLTEIDRPAIVDRVESFTKMLSH